MVLQVLTDPGQIGHDVDTQGAQLLQQTLEEEGATDKKLTELAKTLINVRAQSA